MFKITQKIISIIMLAAIIFAAVPALADTDLLFSNSSVSVSEGKRFNVVVSIDPKGVKNYTTKVGLKYPPDLLEVTSFNFSDDWMQLAQPGYDLIDNSVGNLIKTAGYSGGVSAKKIFGIVSFRAKKEGDGMIIVSDNSMSLDANNKNMFSGTFPSVALTIGPAKEIKEEAPEFEIPEKIQEGYVFTKDFRLGDKSIDVAYLQLCLKSEGVYTQSITGDFDSLTKEGVAKFQERYVEEILAPWGLMEGTGFVSQITRHKLNEVCFVAPIPEQLFDINFELENYVFTDISELVSRTTLISFGRVPTPVTLTFTILDENGKQVYGEKDEIIVETEEVLTKRFKDFVLAPGKYTLILTTLYNVDVVDEFRQDFEIITEEKAPSFLGSILFWILIVAALILISIIVGRVKQNIKKNEKTII